MAKKPKRTGNRHYSPLAGLVPVARELYEISLLSSRQIARALGVSQSWVVDNIVKPRDRSTANSLARRNAATHYAEKA